MKRVLLRSIGVSLLIAFLPIALVPARGQETKGKISSALQPFVDSKSLAGAVTLVATKDRVLTLETVGFADIARMIAMPFDAIFWIASMTKPITGAALMMLVDDGKLKRFAIAHFEQEHRHVMQARDLRGAPAPLAGDDFVLIDRAAHSAHQDRLNHAALADRRRKLVEFGIRKDAARIARIGFEKFDRHTALAARALQHRGFVADIADQRGEPAAQS